MRRNGGARRRIRHWLAFAAAGGLAGAAAAQTAPDDRYEAEAHDRTLYAIGVQHGRELRELALSPEEVDAVARGLQDAALGAPLAVNENVYRDRIDMLRAARLPEAVGAERAASEAFVASFAGQAGARRVEPGFYVFELDPGRGRVVASADTDTVLLHFHGRLRDGSVFDSSVETGRPRRVALARLPVCLREGVVGMRIKGRRRLICPAETGYGELGTPKVPGGAALDIEVQLLGIAGPRTRTP